MESPKTNMTDFWKDVALASLPFVIGFVSIPLAILLPNLIEFDYRLSVVWPFLCFCVLSIILLAGVGLIPSTRGRTRLYSGFFFLGVFFLLSDIFAPLQWGILDGESALEESWRSSLIELALMALLLLCWAKLPLKLVRAFGVPLTLVILVTQLFGLGFAAYDLSNAKSSGDDGELLSVSNQHGDETAIRGNVYHIVFDGYSGLKFPDTVKQLELSQMMSGFTFFENTLANYHMTDASVPSFLHGEFYSGGSFIEWQREAKTGGLRRVLQESGFSIEVYSPDRARFWMYDGASIAKTSQNISRSYFRGSDEFRLAQVTLVRLAPNVLRQEAFWSSDRLWGYIIALLNNVENPGSFSHYGYYKRLSVPLARQFLEEEPSRESAGRYVYLHIVLPHQPFVWDSDCNYSGQTSYDAQTLCATRLMGEIIETLKGLDHYNTSLIIFHSDHGYHGTEAGQLIPDYKPSREAFQEISSVNQYIATEGYFRRIHPLLAIKPPAADASALRTSSAPAQLIDIPATIYDLVGIAGPDTDGESVFQLDESTPREIHLYSGVYKEDSTGKTLILGHSIDETDLVHISFTNGSGWKVYPKLRGRSE